MTESTSKGKIVIIGAGLVGASVAYTIMMNHVSSEIVLIDINKDKARGEALDMNHGMAYFQQINIHDGDFSECRDANIIIISSGIGRKPGQTRTDLAKANVVIAKDVTKNIMQYATNPIILVISNPVDILTYIIQKESGLPANRVIGSGTTLDTGRFRYLLGKHCHVDVRNVHAYIIGEHGDTEVPLWSRANIAGKLFVEYCDECDKKCHNVNRDLIFDQTKNSGAEIIEKKGATYYGVAMAATRIAAAIINDEDAVLTVSSSLSGEYGLSDVALSLPCVINKDGIDRVIFLHPSEDEVSKLNASAEAIKAVLAQYL